MTGSAAFVGCVDGGGGGGSVGDDAITEVALLVAEPDPPVFDAVTVTRSLLPTSAEASPYCAAEAPATEAQFAPAESQRFHW